VEDKTYGEGKAWETGHMYVCINNYSEYVHSGGPVLGSIPLYGICVSSASYLVRVLERELGGRNGSNGEA
jgi:hypothetical protein